MRKLIVILLLSACVYGHLTAATRDQLIAEIRVADRVANDTFVVNTWTLRKFLQRAVNETSNKLRPIQKFDTLWTVSGTNSYAVNSDCYYNGVVGVKILVDSATAYYESAKNIDSRDVGQKTSEATTGNANWYYQYADRLVLEPTPLATYRVEIEYEARCDTIGTADADSSDTTVFKVEHEKLLIDYVRYLLKDRLALPEAQSILDRWKMDVAEARALLQRRADPLVSPQGEKGQ